jgi:hypothetical protein
MKTAPTVTKEVLLGLPPLLVTTEAETHAGIYWLMCHQQCRRKSTNFGHTKNLAIWSTNPSYRCGLTGCFRDMHTTGRSQSSSLTKCQWQNGFDPDNKGRLVWYTDRSKTRKALVLGFRDGAREGGTVSVWGPTPQHSRMKYVQLRLV